MDVESLIADIESVVGKLEAIKLQLQSGEPEFPSWAQELVASKVCLVCREPLGKEKAVRGNHPRHTKAVFRAIARGELTEIQAIEQGKLAPKSPSGRKAKPLAQVESSAADRLLDLTEKREKKLGSKTKKKSTRRDKK